VVIRPRFDFSLSLVGKRQAIPLLLRRCRTELSLSLFHGSRILRCQGQSLLILRTSRSTAEGPTTRRRLGAGPRATTVTCQASRTLSSAWPRSGGHQATNRRVLVAEDRQKHKPKDKTTCAAATCWFPPCRAPGASIPSCRECGAFLLCMCNCLRVESNDCHVDC
jgi:hypothetical protein